MTSTFPKVSIITPSYNQARYLEECIQSVLEQDYPNIEYIIIDGGSTDGSVEILQKYSDRLAHWVSEPDNGQSAGINKGLRRATGDIWAWLNSDDYYMPGAVSKAAAFLEGHPDTGIVYGDCNEVAKDGSFLCKRTPPIFKYTDFLLSLEDFIPSSSTFVTRPVYEHVGEMDETMHFLMDHDYWLRAGSVTKIGYLPEILSSFRVYPEAKSYRRTSGRARDTIYMYEKLLSGDDISASLKTDKKHLLSRVYQVGSDYYWAYGDNGMFRHYLWESIKYAPLHWPRRRIRLLLRALFGGIGFDAAAR
jgi:glycosyltransferase involved in cell wall biosynthesis